MARTTRTRAAASIVGALAFGGLLGCQPTPPVTVPGTTTPAAPTTTAPPTTTTAPATPRLGDEFDGAGLDATRWRAEHSTYGNAGGGSRHCLLPTNVVVAGGSLRITSSKAQTRCPDGSVQPYSSGLVGSRGVGRYYPLEATFAIRAKVPAAQGIWPAFWLRHRNGASVAEVDILESFHSQVPGRATQSLHLDGVTNTATRSTPFETPSATPGWHEFAVAIRRVADPSAPGLPAVRFDFSIDGRPTHSYVDVDPAWLKGTDPTSAWDVALNTAVDGRWVGDPDGALGRLDQISRCSLSGTYPACSSTGLRRVDWTAPVVFEIDWLRVTPIPAAT